MEIIVKNIPTKFIKTEYGDLNLDVVMETLEELEDTTLYGEMLVLYNSKLEKWLLSKNAIKKVIKGSVYKGDGYKELYEEVNNLIE